MSASVENQIPSIAEQASKLDVQIGELMGEIYLLEEEVLRLNRRIESRKARIRKLARQRTEVLNFHLPFEDEASGEETKQEPV